jgi:hypothetical protein
LAHEEAYFYQFGLHLLSILLCNNYQLVDNWQSIAAIYWFPKGSNSDLWITDRVLLQNIQQHILLEAFRAIAFTAGTTSTINFNTISLKRITSIRVYKLANDTRH